jgi:hypothetical protein
MTIVAVVVIAVLFAIWVATDQGDDGLDPLPLRRLHERRAWASKIDPGVALADELAEQ